MNINRRDMATAIKAINLANNKGYSPYDNHEDIARLYARLWKLEAVRLAIREAKESQTVES